MCKSSRLLRCLMMSCGVSHRCLCLTIVMQRMFCQRSTLRLGNSCYIMLYPCSDGAPQDASGCHCVLLVCHLMYCHLPNISPWRLRRFTKSHSHLITTYPATALCLKSSNNFPPRLFFLTLHHIIPPLHPLSSPLAVSGALGLHCRQHPQRRPRRGAAPRRRRGR